MEAGFRARLFSRAALMLVIATTAAAQTETSSPADDAILEAVVRYGRAHGEVFDCVMVSGRDPLNKVNPYTYLDPSASLAARLRKQGFIRYLPSSTDCRNPFWIGPVDRDGNSQARVSAGMLDQSGMGRVAYVMNKNWFGRWRVTDVLLIE